MKDRYLARYKFSYVTATLYRDLTRNVCGTCVLEEKKKTHRVPICVLTGTVKRNIFRLKVEFCNFTSSSSSSLRHGPHFLETLFFRGILASSLALEEEKNGKLVSRSDFSKFPWGNHITRLSRALFSDPL